LKQTEFLTLPVVKYRRENWFLSVIEKHVLRVLKSEEEEEEEDILLQERE
jgi:hypothetical protein